MFSVMCGLSCSLFMVVSCSCFYVVFVFTTDIYTYLFYLISKGIFHLGGLVSKMHISVYVIYRMEVLLFFFFIEYNLGIMNIQCIL